MSENMVLVYFAPTLVHDWWPVKRGHCFQMDGSEEEWVVTGWESTKQRVFISHDAMHPDRSRSGDAR